MSYTWAEIRRRIAAEMVLWGGNPSGSLSPGTFSEVDAGNNLQTVIDVTRSEADGDWDGAYICINPGGSFDSTLQTIWRRLAPEGGFVNQTGVMNLTAPLPGPQYAQIGMTYELYKMFNPEQWMAAANWAQRQAFPQRHRQVAVEIMEDPNNRFYDWANMISTLAISDPNVTPIVTAANNPGSNWAAGTYQTAISYYNAAGETLISPQTSVTLTAGQCPDFSAITVPEQAVGVKYWATPDAGGSQLAELSINGGQVINPPSDAVRSVQGLADYTTLVAPEVQFIYPPTRGSRVPPTYNTTTLDSLKLINIRRRINPGQMPERYIDLSPNYWREQGGTLVEIYMNPISTYALRFEFIAPLRPISAESDVSEEPLELLLSGAEAYLWNTQEMISSSTNQAVWEAQVKKTEMRFAKAKGNYNLGGPRRSFRRPYINIARWW